MAFQRTNKEVTEDIYGKRKEAEDRQNKRHRKPDFVPKGEDLRKKQ